MDVPQYQILDISIHALLAESDNEHPHTRQRDVISIHALLAESDAENPMISINKIPFLSTLSLRRATAKSTPEDAKRWISIHALLAESDPMDVPQYQILDISIHALLAESDKRFHAADIS